MYITSKYKDCKLYLNYNMDFTKNINEAIKLSDEEITESMVALKKSSLLFDEVKQNLKVECLYEVAGKNKLNELAVFCVVDTYAEACQKYFEAQEKGWYALKINGN